jgi:hypothetical protein
VNVASWRGAYAGLMPTDFLVEDGGGVGGFAVGELRYRRLLG